MHCSHINEFLDQAFCNSFFSPIQSGDFQQIFFRQEFNGCIEKKAISSRVKVLVLARVCAYRSTPDILLRSLSRRLSENSEEELTVSNSLPFFNS